MMDRDVARAIRLVVLDADGVLTDGGIYVLDGLDGRPFQLRRFHVQDGLAVKMLERAGIETAIVSGRDSPALRERARELGIREVHQVSPSEKVPTVEGMVGSRGLEWSQVACVADDLADLALMRRVGLPAAVANGVEEVKAEAAWISRRSGGEGAVREFVEALLEARGQWDDLVRAYVEAAEPDGS